MRPSTLINNIYTNYKLYASADSAEKFADLLNVRARSGQLSLAAASIRLFGLVRVSVGLEKSPARNFDAGIYVLGGRVVSANHFRRCRSIVRLPPFSIFLPLSFSLPVSLFLLTFTPDLPQGRTLGGVGTCRLGPPST